MPIFRTLHKLSISFKLDLNLFSSEVRYIAHIFACIRCSMRNRPPEVTRVKFPWATNDLDLAYERKVARWRAAPPRIASEILHRSSFQFRRFSSRARLSASCDWADLEEYVSPPLTKRDGTDSSCSHSFAARPPSRCCF